MSRTVSRTAIAAITFIVAASACSGSGRGERGKGSDLPPGLEAAADDSTRTTATPPAQGSSEGLRSALETAGVRVIADPGESTGGGLELWSYQVDNMEREIDDGAGFLGAQLDDLVGAPGGMPFSYLVAGWLDSAPTPAAEEAVGLTGDQPWAQASTLTFPTAVLVLFVADAVKSADSFEAGRLPSAQLASLAQGGICSTLAGWVNRALDFIFESLKVNTDDGGFLGWLGTIWNAALDLARGLIEGLIELLTAPIVEAIASALSVIGTLSMVASIMQPWSLKLEPSNGVTRFAVGVEPNVQERVVAEADPGYDFDWPPTIEDCASVAGLTLPNPTRAEGSMIHWKASGFPELGSVTETETLLDAANSAVLDWVTGREESDRGEENSGTVSIYARVDLEQIEELKSMLTTMVTGQIPSGPFEGLVSAAFSALTEPIFDALSELVRIKGSTSVTVVYHDEPEEEQTQASAAECVVGTWRVNNDDVVQILGASLGDVAEEVYAEGSVTAKFDEDGTVEYRFSGWKVGNTTFTASPIPGVISDLTGEVYTLSNGSAHGTWRIDGGRIVLVVGDFDTSVTQAIISYELEIDNRIDALPDLARLYVIPNGAALFHCDDNRLGVEWADGIGVRWFRTR